MNSTAALSGNSYRSIASLPRQAHGVLRLLERVEGGVLTVRTPDGKSLRFGAGDERATIVLSNWKVFGDTLRSGDIGFAESYIRGDWHTDDLAGLLTFLVANRNRLENIVYGNAFGRLFHRVRHLFNRNSRVGARRNIHAHYDLGNAFYALWLDRGMTYSSGLFDTLDRELARDGRSDDANHDGLAVLQRAQTRKIRRALEQLDIAPGSSLLEIGCGWGSLAEEAVADGAVVRGLTLSDEQLLFARQRLGQAEGCEFALQDYRDEDGRYDAIASIEMFEAVGEAYWPGYFQTVSRCLKPGGKALVQTITIADSLYERYRRGSDFIQQYVFPGGMLPTPSAFREQARAAGLVVTGEFRFGSDYARTLALWRERFVAVEPQARQLGFDNNFMRTWVFYLAYCEAAFTEQNTDVIQFTLTHE